ncbi:protein kinase domain-containing protein [Actinomadura rupiterrae]|uniref:protein kinase domain-containing protein n=1 Tax=Actinomadura rupiterrae TaxID=559627 RepID=UPI0020A2D7BE|nr:protein kinase [Actinomadura rupiterrae]MCP2339880.1 serine/threonine protein kinase [Actinomadura rupiterrae]
MKGVATSGDSIGQSIGHYRVLETLGEGGMGVVYLGADPEGRDVAIKVLRPSVAGDATARRRLAREVDSMRRVHSPNVAEILDADVTAERPYIVTQYVRGRTLEEVVEEGGPLYGRALQRLAVGLAGALSAIHGAGIIHRDLKPANVMLLDGEPIVIDFGIAQAADATRLTATGMVIGTPGYLAPEIIEGEDAGPPSDVHAWAGTVGYAATGRPPFGSGTFESIFYKIMQGRPDLDGVPDALLPVLRSAMARHPAERPTAVALTQLVRKIHVEATFTDQTRIDDQFSTRPDHGNPLPVPPVPLPDQVRQFAMPAPDAGTDDPETVQDAPSPYDPETLRDAPNPAGGTNAPNPAGGTNSTGSPGRTSADPDTLRDTPPPMAAPVSAQPKDFVGMLPPAAPPPVPPPAPGLYDRPSRAGYPQPVQGHPPAQPPGQTWPPQDALRRGDPPQPYDPYRQPTQPSPDQRQRPDQRPPGPGRQPPGQQPQHDRREKGEQPKPFGWYRVLSLLVLGALVAFANIAPLLAVAVTVAGVLVLRAGDKAARGMEGRRTRRGPRAGDAVGAAFRTPLHLPGAVMATALLSGLAAFAGAIMLGVLMFAYPDMTASRAIAYSAMVVIGLLTLAPGSGAPRRQLARVWGALLPRAEAALAGVLVLGVFTAVLAVLSQKQPPDTTPVDGMSNSLDHVRSRVEDILHGHIPFVR